MDANEEKKQWEICPFCGTKKVKGDYAKGVIARMIKQGCSQEEAETYVNGSNAYLECPNSEEHGAMVLVPFNRLEHGAYYSGSCRNASFARWNAEKQQFVYMREKFGEVYPEEIGYWVEAMPGEHRFDEFRPYSKMVEPLFEIPLTAY